MNCQFPSLFLKCEYSIYALCIQITASSDWVQASEESVKSACEAEVQRNTSLWVPPADGKPPAPPTYITDALCPDNCNNQGTCNDGILIVSIILVKSDVTNKNKGLLNLRIFSKGTVKFKDI